MAAELDIFFSFWELGFRVENFPQKITNKENKLSFVIVLHCLRVKQHVFKTDKAHNINPEVHGPGSYSLTGLKTNFLLQTI